MTDRILNITADEMLDGLIDLINEPIPSEDDGWLSTKQIYERTEGVSKRVIYERLKRRLEAGEVEMMRYGLSCYWRLKRDQISME